MVINFYTQAKTNFEALQQAIQATPMSRAAHEDAIVIYNHPHLFTPVQAA